MPTAASPETEKIKSLVEHFRTTGQIDPEALQMAKEQILPHLGLSQEEIETLGPVEIMLRLQKELTPSPPQKPNPKPATPALVPPPSLEHAPTPVPASAPLVPNPQEVEELSKNLTEEISAEIQRQLEGRHELENVQGHLDQLVTSFPAPEKPKVNPQAASPEPTNVNVDPLQASLDAALGSLKEGQTINADWSLRRIYTTSFGNNQSPFYELQNKTGAIWTLNQDEMKQLLKQQLTSGNFHADVLQASKPPTLAPEPKTETQKTEPDKPQPEKSTSFSSEQIAFLQELAKDDTKWGRLTSFTEENWASFFKLYKENKLSELGINKDPVLDQVKNPDASTSVLVTKDDTISKILQEKGFSVSFNHEDGLLFGLHLLINYAVIKESHKHIEESGIALEPLPNEKEILELSKKAQSGDETSFEKIKDSLVFLPIGKNFLVIKAERFEQFQKLI